MVVGCIILIMKLVVHFTSIFHLNLSMSMLLYHIHYFPYHLNEHPIYFILFISHFFDTKIFVLSRMNPNKLELLHIK